MRFVLCTGAYDALTTGEGFTPVFTDTYDKAD